MTSVRRLRGVARGEVWGGTSTGQNFKFCPGTVGSAGTRQRCCGRLILAGLAARCAGWVGRADWRHSLGRARSRFGGSLRAWVDEAV
eukprot:scaffold116951_cov66-Phaeocystis_antarctica.AAC.2